jgi:CRP-like cAMP-binding protein
MALDLIYLKALPLLRGLSLAEQRDLAARLELVQAPAGQVLIEQGSADCGLYFILNGTIQVTRTLPTGHQITTARLGKGHMIGYLSMLDGLPRSATVRVLKTATLALLPRAHGLALINGSDPLGIRFQRLLAREMIRSLRLANERFTRAASLPPAEFLSPENLDASADE